MKELIFSVLRWFKSRLLPATHNDLEEMENRLMSKLSNLAGTLNDATTHLRSIDDKVKALVAAEANSDVELDEPTQKALDDLVAEVNTVDTDTPPAATAAPAADSSASTQ